MKKIISFTSALLLVIPLLAQAGDEFKIKLLRISAGDDPISSGLTGIVELEKEKTFIQIAGQQEQAWFLGGKIFKMGKVEGIAAWTVGHLQEAPYVGPFGSVKVPLSKNVSISTFSWPAFFAWEPKKWKTENDGIENPESLLMGYLGSLQVDIGPIGLVYSWLNFLDEPLNHLPGVVYTHKLREDFSVSGSAIYNNNDEKWMFCIGAKWTPS